MASYNLFKENYTRELIFKSNRSDYVDLSIYLTTVKIDFFIPFWRSIHFGRGVCLKKINNKLAVIKDNNLRKGFYELFTCKHKKTILYDYLCLEEFKNSILYQLHTKGFKETTSKHYYLAYIEGIEGNKRKIYKLYDGIGEQRQIIEEKIKKHLNLIKKPLFLIKKEKKYVNYSGIDDINLNGKIISYRVNLGDILTYNISILTNEQKIKINDKVYSINNLYNILIDKNKKEYKFAIGEYKKGVYPFHFASLYKIQEVLLKIFSFDIVKNIFINLTNTKKDENNYTNLSQVALDIQQKINNILNEVKSNISLLKCDKLTKGEKTSIEDIKYLKEYKILTDNTILKGKKPISLKKNLIKIYLILQYYVKNLTGGKIEFKEDKNIKVIEENKNIKRFIFIKDKETYEVNISKNQVINYIELAYIHNGKFIREFFPIKDYKIISLYNRRLKFNLEKYKHLELKVDINNLLLSHQKELTKDLIDNYIKYLKTHRNNIRYRDLAKIIPNKHILEEVINHTYAVNTEIPNQFLYRINQLLKQEKKESVLIGVRYDDKINIRYNIKYFLIKNFKLYLIEIINKIRFNSNIANYIVSTLNLKLKENLTIVLPDDPKLSYIDFINEVKDFKYYNPQQNVIIEKENSYLIYTYKNGLIYKIFTVKDFLNFNKHKDIIKEKYQKLFDIFTEGKFYIVYDIFNKINNL